ncbi:glycosyltransferase [Caballeronia sp. BR00000012568055]|uniref:glycosyltransferase n=1 Tax=Caballeronia sp. BR00000012568055 TaxID=2918761 RepID=UPI0023F644B0|nr:glycosyltransferase [Caballeronia sp. BR00000012568055]
MPVKLGIYCDSGINGGHEEMLKRFMRALVSNGSLETLHVFVPTANVELHAHVSELARTYPKLKVVSLTYTAESLRGNMLAIMRAARRTADILRELQISKLLLAQGTIVSGLAGLFAARFARVPAVSYLPLVDDAPARAGAGERVKWMVKRALYRMPHEFVTLNDYLRGKLERLAPRARTMTLENYVDDRFSRSDLSKKAARAALGLPDDGTRIVTHIGRIMLQQKRQDFVLEAIQRNPAAFENTLVLIVGDGPDAPRLRACIESSPVLAPRVKMIGPKADVLPYIVASDALVLPSRYEGVPLVMIESVLAERPIVVSRVSGLDAYLPDALLFPADDHDAFVERLRNAQDFPIGPLTASFRRRFSRDVFDAQAQRVLLLESVSDTESLPRAREAA